MRFIDEHPEAVGSDGKTDDGLFDQWMEKRFPAIAGK
jgi:hypothetical protein